MSVKVTAPAGLTEVIANGLYQWDYGQQLEVTHEGLPALVEVHFACKGMSEAVVRSCSVSADGTLTAAIPDRCLEQTAPVYAWVVALGATSSTTVLKVILPITERTRPATGPSEVPEEISNRYTESIAAINEQIGALTRGDVIARRAKCDEQGKSILFDYATKSPLAKGTFIVGKAKAAETDNEGNVIHSTYVKKGSVLDMLNTSHNIGYDLLAEKNIDSGVYLVRVRDALGGSTALLLDTASGRSAVFYELYAGTEAPHRLSVSDAGSVGENLCKISKQVLYGNEWTTLTAEKFDEETENNIILCRLLYQYPKG